MTKLLQRLAPILLATALVGAGVATAGLPPIENVPSCTADLPDPDPDWIVFGTPLGDIVIETYSDVAPETVANFHAYIDGTAGGGFDDTIVHRIVPGFVIQMGGYRMEDRRFVRIERDEEVRNELCVSNTKGTLAMAKAENQPNSATSEWFINLGDNSQNLDNQNGGFTVFGKILGDGLQFAQRIAALEDLTPQDLIPPYTVGAQFEQWQIFFGTPLQAALEEDPSECFDPALSGLLLVENPTDFDDWDPDEDLGLLFTLVSSSCADDGQGAEPDYSCTDPAGRRMLVVDPETGALTPDPFAEFGFAEVQLSCGEFYSSLRSYDRRIDDLVAQLNDELLVTTYAVVPAPEPRAGLIGLVAAGTVALLRRRRAR